MGNYEEKKAKSKYNTSQHIIDRINDMIIIANSNYRKGEYMKWFYEWKTIKLQIIGKLSKESNGNNLSERDKLKELERNIVKNLKIKSKCIPLIEEYVTLLQDYMEEKEIGLVSQGDDTIYT